MTAPVQPSRQPDAAPAGPCSVVIFGAAGDLTRRLLVPALFNLANTGLVNEHFGLLGADIADLDAAGWTGSLRAMLESFVGDPEAEDQIGQVDDAAWNRLTAHADYVKGDFTEDAFYEALKSRLEAIEAAQGTGGNRLFYLAVADRFFAPIVEHLGRAGLLAEHAAGEGAASERAWRRIVVEKPFGHDLASARALNRRLLDVVAERQIYRIDHFLGKETVQNIMALRFGNGLFDPLWNRDRIDHVQITVAETVGVEGRAKFYEQAGALRDMVPNHVFQLVAMVAMEPPVGVRAEAIRDKKLELFSAIRTMRPEDAVRGQYGAGEASGRTARAYREEPGVAAASDTETYVALRLAIDNWRWAGVPFYLRTGKHLAERMTEIAIRFRKQPLAPFKGASIGDLPPNWLVLRIQPDEGIAIEFEVKQPGQTMRLAPARMQFRYRDRFRPEPNVGYETLLYDCMIGDQTLFQRADMVEETWRVVGDVLADWASRKAEGFPNYRSFSEGPEAADRLLSEDDPTRRWRPVALDPAEHGA
ncbi:MAG TPA: glucose-6-phosphate dehydrogenase [Acidiphilium sp.]|nr:glucose-6-phosphate dehydrogenase [Acidiphilium sp.]